MVNINGFVICSQLHKGLLCSSGFASPDKESQRRMVGFKISIYPFCEFSRSKRLSVLKENLSSKLRQLQHQMQARKENSNSIAIILQHHASYER